VPASTNDRERAIADIEAHLAVHGASNWRPLREQYAHLSDASWWRYVKLAKEKVAAKPLFEEARQQLTERAARTTQEEKVAAAAACLPATPSPDFIAKAGEKGRVQLDLLQRFEELHADALLLREFATSPAENGSRKIRNPMFFHLSIKVRDDLLNTALKAAQAVYDLQRMQQFYDLIVEEIARENPECAQRIMERLQALNERAGISFNATV
jgi:hypothetical protein